MRAVVHQPQYFPYPGFFHKLGQADVFVVMDDVQYDRGFMNRNRILDTHGPVWLTVPVVKPHRPVQVREVEINNELPWAKDHWQKLLVSYSNSRFFGLYRDELRSLYEGTWRSLCDLNLETLERSMRWLGIRVETIRESELGVTTSKSQRIVDVCRAIGADTYLSGRGGRDYIDEALFRGSGVRLEFQDYSPRPYPQRFTERFVPDLSILDLLANAGPGSAQLLAPTDPVTAAT